MLKVCVIGGGPSGLMAAYTASLVGHQVELFEKNKQLGKKLQLTGHGRCNVTNSCSKDEFFKHIVHNEKFLYSPFSQFSNLDMTNFLKIPMVYLPLKKTMGVCFLVRIQVRMLFYCLWNYYAKTM